MKTITLTTLAGIVLLTGCSNTATTRSEVSMTDTQVEEGILSRYAADADLNRADLKVDADVSDHKVTVSGTVPTEAMRSRAVEMAQSFQNSLVVNSKIDVKPADVARADYTDDMARSTRERAKAEGNNIGDSLDDAWIHTKISTKLATDRDTPGRRINVDVEKNAVTLRGEVDTPTAKSEAERIAKETDGVKRVRNLLVVKP
jgi:hyperosmotically inducible periplasmic protein